MSGFFYFRLVWLFSTMFAVFFNGEVSLCTCHSLTSGHFSLSCGPLHDDASRCLDAWTANCFCYSCGPRFPDFGSTLLDGVAHAHTLCTNTRARRHAHIHCETHTDRQAKWQTRGANLLVLTCCSLSLAAPSKRGEGSLCVCVCVCMCLRVSFPHSILVGLFPCLHCRTERPRIVAVTSRPFSGRD